ncbi:hypothetical protein AAE478_008859 [Parahypoxylon ruwenzoriense]
MKHSILVATSAAMLAMGSPLEKRKMETTWVWDWETVTVTGTETAKPTLFFGQKHRPQTTEVTAASVETAPASVVVVTVSPEAPAPVPTTQVPSVVIVTQTPQAAAATTTTAVPVVQAPESAAPQTTSEPQEPANEDFNSAAVYHHNIHRSNHSSSELLWSDTLAGYAANTAATCKMAHDMNQGNGGYGQNLANWAESSGAFSLGATGAVKMAITDMWYNGEFNKFLPQFYGESTPDMSTFESWGHYSQLIWKSSEQVGCASQYCEKGTMYDDFDAWFTVCNYGPAGNVGGAYGDNVLQPLGKSIVVV